MDIEKLRNKIESDSGRELSLLQLKAIDEVNECLNNGTYVLEEIECQICGGNDFEKLSSKDRYGLQMSVSLCGGCGLVFTNPRMNQEAYNAFYQQQYRQIYNSLAGATDEYFNKRIQSGARILDWIEKKVEKINPENPNPVVEIGCSAGSILNFFKNQGHNIIGCDLNSNFIDFGVKKGLDLYSGSLNDIKDKILTPPKLIIYSHVMEHVLDLKEELRLIKEVSDEDTILYIEVPGVKYLFDSYQMSFMKYLQNAHVFHFTAGTLTNLLESNGFEILNIDEYVRVICRVGGKKDVKRIKSDYLDVRFFLENLYRNRLRKKIMTAYGRGVLKYQIKRRTINIIKKLVNYKKR